MTPSHHHAQQSLRTGNDPGDLSEGMPGAVSYRHLLALAHEDGLRSIRTTLLQFPAAGNNETAIVRAIVVTNRGTFSGLADANPTNIDLLVAGHLVSLAETRAEARALRKAVNVRRVVEMELQPAVSSHDEPGPTPDEARGPSDAQRRYLFQLLAKQGLDGELARDFVHHELGVASLGSASRSEIYALIDRLRRSHFPETAPRSDRRSS